MQTSCCVCVQVEPKQVQDAAALPSGVLPPAQHGDQMVISKDVSPSCAIAAIVFLQTDKTAELRLPYISYHLCQRWWRRQETGPSLTLRRGRCAIAMCGRSRVTMNRQQVAAAARTAPERWRNADRCMQAARCVSSRVHANPRMTCCMSRETPFTPHDLLYVMRNARGSRWHMLHRLDAVSSPATICRRGTMHRWSCLARSASVMSRPCGTRLHL